MRRRFVPVLFLALALSVAAVARADWPRRDRRPVDSIGTLYVISRPWSNVKVDGRRYGPTPVRIQLTDGFHRLELRSGDLVHRERIRVRGGDTVRVMHRF